MCATVNQHTWAHSEWRAQLLLLQAKLSGSDCGTALLTRAGRRVDTDSMPRRCRPLKGSCCSFQNAFPVLGMCCWRLLAMSGLGSLSSIIRACCQLGEILLLLEALNV